MPPLYQVLVLDGKRGDGLAGGDGRAIVVSKCFHDCPPENPSNDAVPGAPRVLCACCVELSLGDRHRRQLARLSFNLASEWDLILCFCFTWHTRIKRHGTPLRSAVTGSICDLMDKR